MSFLKIQPGEHKRVFIFATIGLLINGGLTLGISAIDALFLSKLGSKQLPYIYILLPFAMMALTPFSSYVQSRFKIESVMRWVLCMIAIGAISLGLLIQLSEGHNFYNLVLYFVKLVSVIWYIGLYTIFWNYIDAYFSIVEGKRLYGIINAGSCLGIIIFGSLLVFLSNKVNVSTILYIWAATSLMAWPLIGFAQKKFSNLEEVHIIIRKDENYQNIFSSTLESIRQSRFAFFVTLFYFLLPILTYTNEYFCFSVFSEHGDQQQITALFGQLYSLANVFNLLISLFLFNYLVARWGIRNIVLIQPIVYFFVFLWYYSDLTFASAIFGFFAYQTILPSIDNNNANLLFNALPSSQKRSIRTLIEGLGEPVSIALTGVILLYVVKKDAHVWTSLTAIGATVLVAIVAYSINQLYIEGILKNLKENWSDITALKNKVKRMIRDHDIYHLKMQLAKTHNNYDRLNIIGLLLKIVPPKESRVYIQDLITFDSTYQAQIKVLLIAYLEVASEHDTRVIKNTIHKLPGSHWIWSLDILIPFGIISSKDLYFSRACKKTSSLIFSRNLSEIIAEEQTERIPYLLKHLNSDTYRLDALRGITQLVQPAMYQVAKEVSEWIPYANGEELNCCLQIIKETKHADSIRKLIAERTDYSRKEQREIIQLISHIGARSVPILLQTIQSNSISIPGRSLALNALSKISFPHIRSIWGELLNQEVINLSTYHKMGKSIQSKTTEDGFLSLKETYTDLRDQTLEWILEILSIAGKIPDYQLLLDSLNSENVKEQANGIEIIIEGAGIKCFKRIEQFLNCYIKSSTIYNGNKNEELSAKQIIDHALSSQQELLVLAACHACFSNEQGVSEDIIWNTLNSTQEPSFIINAIGEYYQSNKKTGLPYDKDHICKLKLINFLHKHSLFQCLKLTDLQNIIPYLNIQNLECGARLPEDVFCLPYNEEQDALIKSSNPNHVIFFDTLKRKNDEQISILGTGELSITFTRKSLERMIQIYPKFGFHLIKQKHLEYTHA